MGVGPVEFVDGTSGVSFPLVGNVGDAFAAVGTVVFKCDRESRSDTVEEALGGFS